MQIIFIGVRLAVVSEVVKKAIKTRFSKKNDLGDSWNVQQFTKSVFLKSGRLRSVSDLHEIYTNPMCNIVFAASRPRDRLQLSSSKFNFLSN